MHWTGIARRQGGILRRTQLLAHGSTSHRVDGLLRAGILLHTAHGGVYRVAGAPRTPDAEAWLAVLGAKAVLSYLSAAEWWGITVPNDGRIHVTRRDRQRLLTGKSIRVHRTLLVPSAVTNRFGLPITTRPETLMDCLGWVAIGPARDLLDRAFQQPWLTRQDIERRLDEQAGRWGNKQLARLLRESMPDAEAKSERKLHRILKVAGIAGWRGNMPIVLDGRGFRIDVAFPDLMLAIEVDGWAFHRNKQRRDRDILKVNGLTKAGWRVLIFSWEDVNERPDYVLTTITSVLAASTPM
jgi:very-short-patch-repair endonuclease